MEDTPPPLAPVNRQTTTPFLLKLYYQLNAPPLAAHDFPHPPFAPAFPHVEIHTWPDCTLNELAQMLTTAVPQTQTLANRERLLFRLVYADTKTGRYKVAEMGSVDLPAGGGKVGGGGDEGSKGLRELGFVQGDWIVASVTGGASGTGLNSGVTGMSAAGPGFGSGGRGGGRGGRVPTGEWKRGERVEEDRGWGGRRGGGGGGWGGRGGRFGGGGDRRW